MRFQSRTHHEQLDLNLTPLIDVVFLLLIFFMVSTTFVEHIGLSVDLPSSSSRAAGKTPERVQVTLSADGSLQLDDETVALSALGNRVKQMTSSNDRTMTVLRADKSVRHERVVEVLDALQQAGIQNVAIATAPNS